MHKFKSSAASYLCILTLEQCSEHVICIEMLAGLNFPKLKLLHFIPQMQVLKIFVCVLVGFVCILPNTVISMQR